MVNAPERNHLIVNNYTDYALDRTKALAFCVDVLHAKDLAAAFQEKGISAEDVYGAMSDEEREKVGV